MKVYSSDDGRAGLIRLERGSDVLRSLDEAAEELGIHAGTVQAIGAVSELVVGYYKQAEKRYVTIPFPEHLEIGSALGTSRSRTGNPSCTCTSPRRARPARRWVAT
jgi:predicted DNA-binding protein with PD1-like motif